MERSSHPPSPVARRTCRRGRPASRAPGRGGHPDRRQTARWPAPAGRERRSGPRRVGVGRRGQGCRRRERWSKGREADRRRPTPPPRRAARRTFAFAVRGALSTGSPPGLAGPRMRVEDWAACGSSGIEDTSADSFPALVVGVARRRPGAFRNSAGSGSGRQAASPSQSASARFTRSIRSSSTRPTARSMRSRRTAVSLSTISCESV